MSKETFREYLQAKGHTAKSIASRMAVIDRYFKWLERENPSGGRAGLEVEQISYNDLLLYMKDKRGKGAGQRALQNYIGAIKHLYDYLLEQGKVSTNPALDIVVKGVKRKVLYHILEPDELHVLYNQYPTVTLEDKHNKVMLGMLVYQGLKTEELAKLEVKDVQLREGLITVPGGHRSNGREMKLEVHQVMDMYDYVLQVRGALLEKAEPTDKLFIGQSKSGNRLRNSTGLLTGKIRKLNTGVTNLRQIRASVITKWLKVYNLREVQYLAGHRYTSSTEWYLENDMEGLQEQVQQYHPLG